MKKRSITLLEIMIVILLIGLIGGVVSYNLKGTLDKGKAFRSKEGAQKLQDILNLELQITTRRVEDLVGDSDQNHKNVIHCIEQSGLVANAAAFVKDGWGEYYSIVRGTQNTVKVSSRHLRAYEKAHSVVTEDEE
jgi:type II secretory pathway pseudopilin PulG